MTTVAISPDGTWLAALGWRDNRVWVWDRAGARPVAMMRTETDFNACVSLNSRTLVVTTDGGINGYELVTT